MKKKLQQLFQLTDQGVDGLIKAIISSFFLYFAYMLPLMLVLFFLKEVLAGVFHSPFFYLIVVLIAIAVMFVLIYINYNTTFTETYKESKNLRIDIADVLKKLPLSYFSKHDTSDLSQTFMADVEAIEHALSHAIPQAFGLVIFFCFAFISMLFVNATLAFVMLLPILISVVLLFLSKKMQVKNSTKYYRQLRDNSEKFQETIELQQEIKSYGQKDQVKQELLEQMDLSEKIHVSTEAYQAVPLLLSSSILKFSFGLTIYFGATLYLQNQLSLLFLMGFLVGASKLMFSIDAWYEFLAEIMYLDARIKRIGELRQTKVQEGEETQLQQFDISLQHVDFSYLPDKKVIDDLSFTARQNEVTALVGPSGCGKTTVTRLMARLYDYDQGKIIIDGHDIKEVGTDSLFDKVSIVFQEVILFNTTVMENIRIGRQSATDEEVKSAAKAANCLDFIAKLPQGYDTMIGENGSQLSGGQRQRISIARAILKDAPIILLDEISASLDVENELKIQNSLNRLIRNRTVVIISHRLKSIENADKIVVMNQGRVDSVGTHQDLLEESALYRSMIEKSNITEKYAY